jgi:SPP1 family predicted phage head-tail adaptor
MLRAGRLRERITIRRQGDVPDGKGGFTRDWTTVAEDLPAEVLAQSGREGLLVNTFQGTAAYKITVRYRTDLETHDQILWNGEELNIIAPPGDPWGKREETQIFADTSSPQDAGVI